MLVFDQMKKGDRPLWWLTVTILAGMLILTGGLWYHQVYASNHYVESQKTQSFRRVRYPALRGKITDRNGISLADNRACYNVNLYLEELSGRFQEAWRLTKTRADQQRARGVDASKPDGAPSPSWFQKFFGKTKSMKPRLTQDEVAALGKQVRFAVVSNLVFELGNRMGKPLPPLDEKKFHDHYASRLVVPMPVMEDLTSQQMAWFCEMPNKPPGLYLDLQPMRVYPRKTEASHLLGFLRRSDKLKDPEDPELELGDSLPGLPDYEGTMGLEGAFDDDLRGRSGIRLVLVNNLGYRQSATNLVPADPGSNIVTTIDVRVQQAAEQAFRASGATKGAVVVMDPHNGDVLALVSYPAFDPNVFIPRVSPEVWKKLDDPNVNAMFNRATFGEYMPGSIFKIVVGLACLEAETLDPSAVFKTKGYFQSGHRIIKDRAPPGNYDFRRALAKSSNEYFIEQGVKAGLRPIMEMGRQFFLGEKTQMPLMGEASGLIPSDAWLKKMKAQGTPFQPGDLWYLSIGQGPVTVTPIQMAVMTSAVANGGKVLWPRLVQRIEQQTTAPEKTVPRIFPPVRVRGELNVKPAHLEAVREGMLADVEDNEGTGKFSRVAGFKIAGKTGTAEIKQGDRQTGKNTWFVSFGPYEDPRYVVVVLADEGGRSGGGTCGPVARRIYEALQKLEAKG